MECLLLALHWNKS